MRTVYSNIPSLTEISAFSPLTKPGKFTLISMLNSGLSVPVIVVGMPYSPSGTYNITS